MPRADLDDQPIRKRRLDLGYSIKKACEEAGVSWQTWYLTELGCYTEPPPVVLAFFSKFGLKSQLIKIEYNEWIVARRSKFHSLHGNLVLPNPNPTKNPVAALYESLGYEQTSFAKALCVQPAILYKVANAEQRVLPLQLKNALLEVGLPIAEIEELQERYDEYYDKLQFGT